MALVDDSKEQELEGRKRIEIVSSQSPKKSSDPADDAYRARLQKQCDELAAVFITAVGTYRGVSADDVLANYGRGDVLIGASAVVYGLAEQVSNFEAVLADLTEEAVPFKNRLISAPAPTSGANRMSDVKVIARLLKLDDGASDRQIEDRAQLLAQFEHDALAATVSRSTAEALGKIAAGAQAIEERDTLRAQVKEQESEMARRELRGELKEAIKDGRLTLGELQNVVPTLLKEEERERLAPLLATAAGDRKALLAVYATANVGKRLSTVKAYLAAKAPTLTQPRKEPPNDKQSRDRIASEAATVAATEEAKKFAQSYGLKPESITGVLQGSNTVEALEAAIDANRKGA
jgi:hypothetical protein